MNNFGVRAIAKTIKDMGLADHRKVIIGHGLNIKLPAYSNEFEPVEKIRVDSSTFSVSETEKEFATKGFSSEPEVIEDFQYVKPIRLLSAEDVVNFCRKDK